MRTILTWVFGLLVCFGCKQNTTEENFLDIALKSEHPAIKKVVENIDAHEIQIRYTRIEREKDAISFKDFDFNVDSTFYFYPASTIKFPVAVAALEKLNLIDSLNLDSTFFIEGDTTITSFGTAINQLFAVSDNAANNRLIEFVGFDAINKQIKERGIYPFRISHRLATTDADNPTTKPLLILTADSIVHFTKPIVSNRPKALELKGIKKGDGYLAENELFKEPFDFSMKNHFPITAQNQLIKKVFFPNTFSPEQQLQLTEKQRNFLIDAMRLLPYEQGYDRSIYYDSYVKFFLFGDSKEAIPETIKIHNKVGYAYGTLTDCAYIVDLKNNIEFILNATILVNNNAIFNDDTYEYETIGIPFLAQLGREIYELELNNNK